VCERERFETLLAKRGKHSLLHCGGKWPSMVPAGKVRVKVKLTMQQAMKLQRGCRSITLLFL